MFSVIFEIKNHPLGHIFGDIISFAQISSVYWYEIQLKAFKLL